MGATSSPDIESYLMRILPDQLYLPDAGRKALATLVTIDGANAGTDNSLLPVLEEISKNHPLTASDLETLEQIANSITAVAVAVKGALPNNQVRVKYAIKAIAAVMGRAAGARKESEENSEEQELHLGPFTCRESAEKSLEIADDLTSNVSSASLSSILCKFRDMLAVEQVPYTGHSVGFEIEFRSGTCSDEDGDLNTLHPNVGLTATQLANYKQNQAICDSIFDMLSYMANSAARNIVVQNKIFHHIVDEYGTPQRKAPYQFKVDAMRDLACLENQKNKEKKKEGAVKSEFEPQIGRLELKRFCLARDADRKMVSLGIEAVWYALDDPKLAEILERDLKSILAAAAIDMSEVPVVRIPSQDNIKYDKLSADDWRRIDDWSSDFGVIGQVDNQLKGRQVEYREVINYYLKEFNNCNQVVAVKKAVERAEKIKADHDKDCLIQRGELAALEKLIEHGFHL
jgi:hypothetical protein